jgi:hypothetical protein
VGRSALYMVFAGFVVGLRAFDTPESNTLLRFPFVDETYGGSIPG